MNRPVRIAGFHRSLYGGLLVAAMLIACDLTSVGPRSGADLSEGKDHPLVGAPAPDFDLKAQFGAERVSLADHRGQIVIVDFWATWCEPCRVSFPKYEALSRRYEDELAVIGISEDEEAEGIAAFARKTGVTFPLARDRGNEVAHRYEPKTLPTSYIIDKVGLIRFVHPGFRRGDEATIQRFVQSLM